MAGLHGVKVGDQLYYRNANELHGIRHGMTDEERGAWTPPMVTVTKVGTKRVYFGEGRRERTAQIATGRIDDWSWLQTPAAWHDACARADIVKRLRGDHDMVPQHGGIPTGKLAAMLLAAEAWEED